jgi:hypothetical protein
MQSVQQDISATDRVDADLVEYRAVSVMAIVGLVLALCSAAGFGHPVFWTVAVVAVILNLVALRRIAEHSPPLLGRTAALVGLAVALTLGAAAPTQYFVSAARSRQEARQLGRLWLEAITNHNPELAVELEQPPGARLGPEEDLRANYRDEPAAAKGLREFSERPLVEVISAAGQNSRIQYLETLSHQVTLQKERIKSLWRVTYNQGNEPKSVYVQLVLVRELVAPRRVWQWRVEGSGFAADPRAPAPSM